jgi:hypothetical protein
MTATTRSNDAQLGVGCNVHVREHDIGTLREQWTGWDENPKWVKRELARRTEPDREQHNANTTVDGLHEYIVDNLDPSQSVDLDASHLAVGTGTTQPASGNSSLNNEVFRVATTDDSDNGATLFTSTFLDTSEANGNTLEEVGLFTASSGGTLLNHSLISSITKDDETTATIDVSLTFQPA